MAAAKTVTRGRASAGEARVSRHVVGTGLPVSYVGDEGALGRRGDQCSDEGARRGRSRWPPRRDCDDEGCQGGAEPVQPSGGARGPAPWSRRPGGGADPMCGDEGTGHC